MIFLYGSPRSGTTWLGKILDSHPDTLLRHEPDTIIRGEYPFISDELFVDEAREHLAAMVRCRDPKVTGTRPVFHKSYLSPLAWVLKYASVYGVKALERVLPKSMLPDIPDLVGHKNYEIVIKTVSILGRMPSMSRAAPDAKYIHIIRHPCGHTHSVLKGRKSGYLPTEAFLGFAETEVARSYGLSMAMVVNMSEPLQIAWRWAIMNEIALRSVPQAYVLMYDEFCRDPQEGVIKLLSQISMNPSEQTAEFLRSSSQTEGGYFETNRNPLEAANKWQEEFLAADEVLRAMSATKIGQLFPDITNSRD